MELTPHTKIRQQQQAMCKTNKNKKHFLGRQAEISFKSRSFEGREVASTFWSLPVNECVPSLPLQMPVDLDALSPEERRARFRKREAQLRGKEEKEPELLDNFDLERYKQFWTKK